MERERVDGKNRAALVWMGAVPALALVALVLIFLRFVWPHEGRGVVQLDTGWRYTMGDSAAPVEIPLLNEHLPIGAGGTMTLSRTMTERAQDASILLRLYFLNAEVRVGDALIFSNALDPPGPNKGNSYRLIALPDGYLGKEMSIEVSSHFALFSQSPDVILFGSAKALMAHAMANDAVNIVLMFTMALSGLALMAFSLIEAAARRMRREDAWSGIAFGLFSVLFGVFLPANGPAFAMAFSPAASALLYNGVWYLSLGPMVWFLALKCGRSRPVALALAALYSVASVCATAWAWRFAPVGTLRIMNPVVVFLVLALLALVGFEWGHKNFFFRMTAPAFLVLAAAGLMTLLDVNGFYTSIQLSRNGGLVLLSTLVWADMVRISALARRAANEERQLMRLRSALAEEQLAASEAQSKETRMLHHEIRHHLVALSTLQRAGDLQEIGAYLEKLNGAERELDEDLFCEHPLINAILTKARREARNNGIDFTCEAYVPSGIAIPDADLSTLLMNLFENAVEAAQQAEDGGRWIRAKVRVRDEYLVIACDNAIRGSVTQIDGRFPSTKQADGMHGYGLPSMQQIVSKHGSKLNIDHDEHRFSVRTMLRITG